jgi:hypothetical protein
MQVRRGYGFWHFGISAIDLRLVALSALACTLMVLGAVASPVTDPSAHTARRLLHYVPGAVFIILGCMTVTYFATIIYPSIPASLGGGLPRSVTLDIQTSNLAPETLKLLVSPSILIRPGTVVQTHEIGLIAAPGQYYLLEIPSSPTGSAPIHVQLERSAVVAVMWTK